MNGFKIKFYKQGAVDFEYEVPEKYLTKYAEGRVFWPTYKINVWDGKDKNFVSFNYTKHVVSDLFKDPNFVKGLLQYVSLQHGRIFATLFSRAWNRPCKNFYFTVVNPEFSRKARLGQPYVEAKTKAKREKKVKDETKITFRQSKRRVKNKAELFAKLQNWGKEKVVDYHTPDAEIEVGYKIFNDYKEFFEENLRARNIPFTVTEESRQHPGHNRNSAQIYSVYLLLDNHLNVPKETMEKLSWRHITLAWMPVAKTVNRYERKTVMALRRIGIGSAGGRYLAKSAIKGFNSMRETTFSGIVNSVFKENTEKYNSSVEDFKALKGRIVTNKVETKKLVDYLAKTITPYVREDDVVENPINLGKDKFRVAIKLANHWTTSDFFSVTAKTDDLEKLTFSLKFLDVRHEIDVHTADEAIKTIESVFGKNFKVVYDMFVKVCSLT